MSPFAIAGEAPVFAILEIVSRPRFG